MSTSTLTAKGQVTIPEEIRRRLGLVAGVRLHFEVGPEGTILVRSEKISGERWSRLPGLLRHLAKGRPPSVEEMHDAVEAEAAERFRRSTRR